MSFLRLRTTMDIAIQWKAVSVSFAVTLIKTLFGILYLQSSNFINTVSFHILGRSKACFFLEKATKMILI